MWVSGRSQRNNLKLTSPTGFLSTYAVDARNRRKGREWRRLQSVATEIRRRPQSALLGPFAA